MYFRNAINTATLCVRAISSWKLKLFADLAKSTNNELTRKLIVLRSKSYRRKREICNHLVSLFIFAQLRQNANKTVFQIIFFKIFKLYFSKNRYGRFIGVDFTRTMFVTFHTSNQCQYWAIGLSRVYRVNGHNGCILVTE